MTKITVTIDTKTNARIFLEMVRALRFVKNVQAEEAYEDLSGDEIKMLEERWTDYLKNPDGMETWKQIKGELSKNMAAGEILFHPLVKAEIDEIVSYYENQRKGLGLLFLNVLDLFIQQIKDSPLQFQVRHKGIRAATIKNFPYNIYFRIHKNRIFVLAVLHQKRSPKIWKRRK